MYYQIMDYNSVLQNQFTICFDIVKVDSTKSLQKLRVIKWIMIITYQFPFLK